MAEAHGSKAQQPVAVEEEFMADPAVLYPLILGFVG
jgi:hypothetical protein